MSGSEKALILHSGGPTAVLNASLAGAIEEARRRPEIGVLEAARHGVAGLLEGRVGALPGWTEEELDRVAEAPGSVLGSSRYPLEPADFARIAGRLREGRYGTLFVTGGNGSMETARRIAGAAGAGLRVIGIPKTVDNDIRGTDHTPGYPSAARFAAFAARDTGADQRALPPPVTVLEVIGRNTGWVAAATALARARPGDAPHLIYLPERPVTAARMAEEVRRVYGELGRVMVVLCEGQREPDGGVFGAATLDAGDARRALSSNLGFTVAGMLSERLGLRVRAEKPGIVGRSNSLAASPVDREEARECGRAAVRAAAAGHTGVMVTIERAAGAGYGFRTGLIALAGAAGVERRFPEEWMDPERADVTPAFLDWLRPLTGPVPALPVWE